jgi:hypothetical protein
MTIECYASSCPKHSQEGPFCYEEECIQRDPYDTKKVDPLCRHNIMVVKKWYYYPFDSSQPAMSWAEGNCAICGHFEVTKIPAVDKSKGTIIFHPGRVYIRNSYVQIPRYKSIGDCCD